MKVLITGGAGFIGTHLSRRLLQNGCEVSVLDNFLPQVHGGKKCLAADVADHIRLFVGDIRDGSVVHHALEDVEAVVHLAAETGTGQSMYEIARYARTNLEGTAQLYEQITGGRGKIEHIVCASSRAVYGEGAYRCDRDGIVYPQSRQTSDKLSGHFDPLCPICNHACRPAATPEDAPPQPLSFYGLTKLTQEQTALLFANVLRVPSFALRYQNVFGPGQSLENPYTGILAIFSNLARTGQYIRVFEDGLESRDFVYVDDVVSATIAALESRRDGAYVVNVGSGDRTTVMDVAKQINAYFGNQSPIEVTGTFREGDIRHGFADLARARDLLGYRPVWNFGTGLSNFLGWAENSRPSTLGYEASLAEMRGRGLLHG